MLNIDFADLIMIIFVLCISIFILACTFCMIKMTFFKIDIGYENNAHNVQVVRLQ